MKRSLGFLLLALVAALIALPGVPAGAAGPSVAISADKAGYTAGQSAKLSVRTRGLPPDASLEVIATTAAGKTYTVLGRSDAANETRTVEAAVAYNVTFRVNVYKTATGGSAADTATVAVKVRARLTTQTHGGGSVYGGYVYYGRGVSPSFRSGDFPSYAGHRCLRHQVQRYRDNAWRTVHTSSCTTEGAKGRVDWTWTGKHASNVKFRLRATFAGDKRNRPANAPWLHVRFR